MNINIKISVIICTHNPRVDYLSRTLDSLKQQTLEQNSWELLLIDNASTLTLSDAWDISWHLNSRHICEDELGLTPARLRGISEATGDLLVFVDDDNLLQPNYLEVALQISEERAYMGAYGGDIEGFFEAPIPEWTGPYLESLAIRSVKTASWGCRPGTKAMEFTPCGAGMVIRKEVAISYRYLVCNNNLRRSLDRTGASLSSGGDTDMALCACKFGLAVGVFPELKMMHIIPSGRMTLEYTLSLAKGLTASYYLLCYLWDGTVPSKPLESLWTSESLLRFVRRVKRFGREDENQKVAELVRCARNNGQRDAYARVSAIREQADGQ